MSLKQHRRRAYLSARELAAKASVAPGTIWRIERGEFEFVRPATMRRIAEVLNVPPSEIAEFVVNGNGSGAGE